jgi:hypothetical protein
MEKELRRLLKKYPDLTVAYGKKHLQIRHPSKGGFVTVSSTSSDRNYIFNVKRDIDSFINSEN